MMYIEKLIFLIERVAEQAIGYCDVLGGTWIFGEDTNKKLRSFAVNFYQALLDTEHQLPLIKRKSYTSLTVAIDRFKTSHNSLQYNVDRFVRLQSDGKAHFINNGQISNLKSADVTNSVMYVTWRFFIFFMSFVTFESSER